MKNQPDSEVRVSGFATASLVFSVLALGLLGLALPVTLAGSRHAGALVSVVLITASGASGMVAVLLLLTALAHVACSRGKRAGYQRALLSLAFILLDVAGFWMLASKWADRFFRW